MAVFYLNGYFTKFGDFLKIQWCGAVHWTKLFNVTIFISLLPGFGNINNSHVKLHNFSFIFLNVSNFLWVLTTVECRGSGEVEENKSKILSLLSGDLCAIVNFFQIKMLTVEPMSAASSIPRKFWIFYIDYFQFS